MPHQHLINKYKFILKKKPTRVLISQFQRKGKKRERKTHSLISFLLTKRT